MNIKCCCYDPIPQSDGTCYICEGCLMKTKTKTKTIGYVDMNKTEIKKCNGVDFYYKDGVLFKASLKSKELTKQFCNKLNRAKVYEIILREVK